MRPNPIRPIGRSAGSNRSDEETDSKYQTHPPPSPIGRVVGDDEVEIVETLIATELERLNYDALIDQVRIPVVVIADWYKRATGDRNIGTTGVSRRLGQLIGEGQLQRLAKDPSHIYGRCFIWTGENADPFGREIINDLQERIDQERDYRRGGGWGR